MLRDSFLYVKGKFLQTLSVRPISEGSRFWMTQILEGVQKNVTEAEITRL
jgi:hypothetical protein